MQFGPDVTKRFCDRNGLEAIIRSHEVRMDGYEEEHNGKCITGEFPSFHLQARQTDLTTVFSAPRYCDQTENRGAYINVGPDYKLNFNQFDAVPHPNIKPMVSSPTGGFREKLANTTHLGLCEQLNYVNDVEGYT